MKFHDVDLLCLYFCFFFNDTATTEIYTTHNTLSLHDALPISEPKLPEGCVAATDWRGNLHRSEEHTSELQSLCVISYAVFCLKKKKKPTPGSTIRMEVWMPREGWNGKFM